MKFGQHWERVPALLSPPPTSWTFPLKSSVIRCMKWLKKCEILDFWDRFILVGRVSIVHFQSVELTSDLGFDAVDLFQQELEVLLPDDAHQKASGKLFVSLTDATMTNVIVSRFLNRKDLKDALVCSCYLPAFSSYKQGISIGNLCSSCKDNFSIRNLVPTYQDKPYLDGGFSNNQPVVDDANTIRVSPFAGGSHISPVDGPEVRPFLTRFGKEPIQLSASNMKR